MADVKLRMEINPNAQTEADRYYTIDKFNGLKSVSSTTQSVTDGASIQYGILPNTGSAKVVDRDGKLASLIKGGNLADHDVNCDLFLNGNQIQHHLTANSDYYEDKVLTMNFKDSLAQLSERTFSGMPLTNPSTAFGVLSYIFYKMGYALENVGTWTKFRHSSFIAYDELTNTMTSSRGPIVGFPLFITKGEQHTLTIKCTTPTYTPYDTYSGIAVQILENYPDDSSISSAIATEYFDATDSNMQEKTLTFTPTTDKVYFTMDFAYIDNGQTVTTTLNDITLDGNSLASLLQNKIVLNNGNIGTIEEHLKSIKIKYPYLNKSSFEEAINKVCQIAQLNCIEDSNGDIKFVSARPLGTAQDKALHIPRYAQETFPRNSLFIKNKISQVKKTLNITSEQDNTEVYKTSLNFKKVDTNDTTLSIPLVEYDMTLPNYNISKTGYTSLPDVRDYWEMLSITIDEVNIPFLDDMTLEVSQINYQGTPDGYEDLKISSSRFKVVSSYEEFLDTFFRYEEREDRYYLRSFVDLLQGNGSGVYGIILDEYSNKVKILAFVKKGYERYENSTWVDYRASDFVIALYQKDIEQTTATTDSKTFDYELPNNELVQDKTTYDSIDIATVMENNILADYTFGVKSTEIRIKLMDFQNTSGSYSLDYESGEIPNVGDVVVLDSDNFGTSAFSYNDGTPILWRVVGRQFDYSGVPIATLQLQQVRNLFAQLSWTQIDQISTSGMAGTYFQAGDTRNITLTDGSKVTAKIARVNGDELRGGGISGLTIILDTLLPEARAMHDGTAISWADCNMRTWLNSDNGGRAYFPSELLNAIEPRKNEQYKYEGSTRTTETTYDNLWLPTLSETESERLKRAKSSADKSITQYYTRDQAMYSIIFNRTYNHFTYVLATGLTLSALPNSSAMGMRVGFCVGNTDTAIRPLATNVDIPVPYSSNDIGNDYDNVLEVVINGEVFPYNSLPAGLSSSDTIAFNRKYYNGTFSLENQKVNGTSYSWGETLIVGAFESISFSADLYQAQVT